MEGTVSKLASPGDFIATVLMDDGSEETLCQMDWEINIAPLTIGQRLRKQFITVNDETFEGFVPV